MGVTLTESIMGSIPIGLALWYFDVASVKTILEALAVLVATVALSISIYSHVIPARLSGGEAQGGAS